MLWPSGKTGGGKGELGGGREKSWGSKDLRVFQISEMLAASLHVRFLDPRCLGMRKLSPFRPLEGVGQELKQPVSHPDSEASYSQLLGPRLHSCPGLLRTMRKRKTDRMRREQTLPSARETLRRKSSPKDLPTSRKSDAKGRNEKTAKGTNGKKGKRPENIT